MVRSSFRNAAAQLLTVHAEIQQLLHGCVKLLQQRVLPRGIVRDLGADVAAAPGDGADVALRLQLAVGALDRVGRNKISVVPGRSLCPGTFCAQNHLNP